MPAPPAQPRLLRPRRQQSKPAAFTIPIPKGSSKVARGRVPPGKHTHPASSKDRMPEACQRHPRSQGYFDQAGSGSHVFSPWPTPISSASSSSSVCSSNGANLSDLKPNSCFTLECGSSGLFNSFIPCASHQESKPSNPPHPKPTSSVCHQPRHTPPAN